MFVTYCSVPGKHPWALKHNSRFWPAWALTRDINSICLYGSCNSDPLKFGTWALTREWALARDTTLHTFKYYSYVVSELYSRIPGDRNLRHRVANVHIFVNGPPSMLPRLQELLEGKQADLLGLTVFYINSYTKH